MPGTDSAQWILEAMTLLHSPDAELVRNLLQHMASLRVGQSVEVPRFTLCFPQSRSTDLLAEETAEAERELELQLRLARQGDCFRAWCSDGTKWYRCGHTEVKMNEQIQVGLFAECTYRDWFSPTRCTATPVRFAAARLRIGYHP